MDRAMTSRRKEIVMREEFKRELLEEVYKLGFRYLTTDADGRDYIFKNEPEKGNYYWLDKTGSGWNLPLNLWLSSWDDTEPKSIARLLGISEVDWSKIPVDTKILVSINGKKWHKRYFAKYENGYVYAWKDGMTSWNTRDNIYWLHAKLAEE